MAKVAWVIAVPARDSAAPGPGLGLGMAAEQDREQVVLAQVVSVRAASVLVLAVQSWRTAYPRRHQ